MNSGRPTAGSCLSMRSPATACGCCRVTGSCYRMSRLQSSSD